MKKPSHNNGNGHWRSAPTFDQRPPTAYP